MEIRYIKYELTDLGTENGHLKSHLHCRRSFEAAVVIPGRLEIGRVILNRIYLFIYYYGSRIFIVMKIRSGGEVR